MYQSQCQRNLVKKLVNSLNMSDFLDFATESDIASLDDEDTLLLGIEEDVAPEKDDDDDDVENTRNQWAAVVHDLMFRK